MNTTMQTLREFILRVEGLDSIGNAYDVFEGECTSWLCEQIYSLADHDSEEPFRSAMHNMGFDSY